LEVKVGMFVARQTPVMRHQRNLEKPISTIGFRAYYVNKHFFLCWYENDKKISGNPKKDLVVYPNQ
jgi:hypothetical protein